MTEQFEQSTPEQEQPTSTPTESQTQQHHLHPPSSTTAALEAHSSKRSDSGFNTNSRSRRALFCELNASSAPKRKRESLQSKSSPHLLVHSQPQQVPEIVGGARPGLPEQLQPVPSPAPNEPGVYCTEGTASPASQSPSVQAPGLRESERCSGSASATASACVSYCASAGSSAHLQPSTPLVDSLATLRAEKSARRRRSSGVGSSS